MPLIKKSSKKALEKNIKTEMDANPGKEHKSQDLAIAYSTQRMAKKKGMAHGGMAKPSHEEHYASIADAILKSKKMADGGMVEDDNMETPASLSPYDDDNYDAIMKEMYADGGMVDDSTPETDEDQIQESSLKDMMDDEDDSVSGNIRKRMKSRG